MKALKRSIALVCVFIFSNFYCPGQTIYTYPLSQDFSALQQEAPELIQIPNNNGLTGDFVTRAVPISTCGEAGEALGYFFYDDAGLQFNNPASFIDQAYSLAFNFQIDELILPPAWVRILSFTHIDDIGVYIYLTDPPTNGTLQFWPYGNVGEENFFSTVDYYQLILVRNEEGLIKIFINGEEFAEYDDSETQKFLPADPNNFIVFFRDHPSVLSDEASPGFVSDIIIGNRAWTEQEVTEKWEEFCGSLFGIDDMADMNTAIYPNPSHDFLNVSIEKTNHTAEIQIFDLLGKLVFEKEEVIGLTSINVSHLKKGIYLVKIIQLGQTEVHKFHKN